MPATKYLCALICLAISLATTLHTYAQGIKLGKKVLVSKDEPNRMFFETDITASSTSSRDLIGCAMATRQDGSYSTVVFISSDSGRSWKKTLDVYPGLSNFDPGCTFGAQSTAFFISFGFPVGHPDEHTITRLYRSSDAGRTWAKPLLLSGGIDRTWVLQDTSPTSKYQGRIYVTGKRDRRALDNPDQWLENVLVLSSSDNGITFRFLDVPSLSPQIDPSRPVLFPSGDLGLVLSEMNDDKNPAKNKFMFVKSVDGGLSIAAPTQIISRWSIPGQAVSASSGIPALALDPSLGRLYYAWEDWPSGESDVHLMTSSDSGKTWTQPVEIKPSSPSANVFSAALAVNKDGVLGIVYYQRVSPQQPGVWTAYFTASTDGGRTFAPAVALSGQNENSLKPVAAGLPEDRFAYNGGDTVGLTATPDGLFHPFWVDSSTGSVQLWTTTASISRH